MSELILVHDIETTGLNPHRDYILEAAAVIVDLSTLEVIRRTEWLAKWSPLYSREMEQKVREMHMASGLIAAFEDSKETRSYEEWLLEEVFDKWPERIDTWNPPRLAGFSPHFDRDFMRVDAPQMETYFHHRMIDATTMRACLRAWGLWETEKPNPVHRAMQDCEDVIRELGAIRSKLITAQSYFDGARIIR